MFVRSTSVRISLRILTRNRRHFCPLVLLSVNEISDAFLRLSDKDFEKRYGFQKPAKGVSDRIITCCLSGKRALDAADRLVLLGYQVQETPLICTERLIKDPIPIGVRLPGQPQRLEGKRRTGAQHCGFRRNPDWSGRKVSSGRGCLCFALHQMLQCPMRVPRIFFLCLTGRLRW